MKMAKIRPDDLDKIGDTIKRTMLLREGTGRAKVIVHMGTCGIAAGARTVMKALMDEIESREVKDVLLTISSCAGLCSREPMATLEITGQAPVKYGNLTTDKIQQVLKEHIINGNIIKKYAIAIGSERAH